MASTDVYSALRATISFFFSFFFFFFFFFFRRFPVEQIMRVFQDNLGIIFDLFSIKTYVVGTHYNRLADSNQCPQDMFLWRTEENYPSIITKYPPYVFHCVFDGSFHGII